MLASASLLFKKQREAENASPGPLVKARYILAKRRAKKLFIRFTTPSPTNRRVPGWRRREKAANGLVEIIEKEAQGEDLVGRRFTKTASRQESVTRAILSLSDEEYDRDVKSSGLERDYLPVTVNGSGPAVRLLGIVIKHSKGSSFFEDSIPRTLEGEQVGSAAILFLAATFPRFFELVDPRALLTYSTRIVKRHFWSSIPWLRGIRLLDLLMSHLPPSLRERRYTQLLVAHTVTEQLSRRFAPPLPGQSPVSPKLHPLMLITTLQAGVNSLLQAEGNHSDLRNILPPDSASKPLIYGLQKTIGRYDPDDKPKDIEAALALKMLALLRDTSAGKRFISGDHGLVDTCMEIMLSKPKQKDEWKDEYGGILRVSYLRTVDEDAFDVLCCLPEPVFAKALASKLQKSALGLNGDKNDPSDVFQLLDPLLWLSNMPPNIKEAHRALVDGGTCGFLRKIIDYPVALVWTWQDRDVWRAKGQAMACLGNIIERMDKSQMRAKITKQMIETVVAIKTNEEAPLSERDHAKFTLQRYTAAAHRCRIELYYREEVQASN